MFYMKRSVDVIKLFAIIGAGCFLNIIICYMSLPIRTLVSNKVSIILEGSTFFIFKQREASNDGMYKNDRALSDFTEHMRINRKGSWQCQSFKNVTKNVTSEACFYSAHYDTRPRLTTKPVLRIQTVSSIKENILSAIAFCEFFYYFSDDSASKVQTPRIKELMPITVTRAGRGHRVNTGGEQLVYYGQYQLSCDLPEVQETPTHVSIVLKESEFEISNLLPILRNSSSSQKKDDELVICVPISFGHINLVNLVNWIELNKMLGVTRVVVYNSSLDRESDPIFDFYRDLVVVHQIIPPVPDRRRDGVKLGSPAGLNDCLMRQMHFYRHVIVCDFDEIIVPRDDITLVSLLAKVKQDKQKLQPGIELHSYTVQNAFFFFSYPPDIRFSNMFPYFRYRFRLKHSAKPVLGKSFLDPMLCVSVFNHYCLVPALNSARAQLDTSLALSHHYKNCTKLCEKIEFKNALPDDTMLRYTDKLHTKVKSALELYYSSLTSKPILH